MPALDNIVQYNEISYFLSVLITDEKENIQLMQKQDISNIYLDRNIDWLYTRGSMVLQVHTNSILLYPNQLGGWLVNITFVPEGSMGQSEANSNDSINFIGIITCSEVLSVTPESVTVKIYFSDIIEQVFRRNIVFSSQANKDISEVLLDMLKENGFTTDKLQIPNIGKPFNYIADVSGTLYDHVQYLLSQMVSKEHGFLFLFYNPKTKELESIWSKDEMVKPLDDLDNEENDAGSLRVITLPGMGVNIATPTVPFEFIGHSAGTMYKNYVELTNTTFISNFNQIKNELEFQETNIHPQEWHEELYKEIPEHTQVFVPKSLHNADNILLKDYAGAIKVNDKSGVYYQEANEQTYYKSLRTLYLKGKNTSAKMNGYVDRNPGDYYAVAQVEQNFTAPVNGKWFCARIIDVITTSEFVQYIFITRSSDEADSDTLTTIFESMQEGSN